MQYHYVVLYDSLDKTFTVDVDGAVLVFHQGYFFDEVAQTWLDPDDERMLAYSEDYLEVEEQLALTLLHHDECVAPFCKHCEGN